MSCPKTQHLLTEYFADDLAAVLKDEIQSHLSACQDCSDELESVLNTQAHLSSWQDQKVPHWDRGLSLFRDEHGVPKIARSFFSGWQWLPTASSFAMLCVLLLNVNFISDDKGMSISFGGQASSSTNTVAEIEARLEAFEKDQDQQMQIFLARMDDRQDSNNLRLIQAVTDRSEKATAVSMETLYRFMEEQRQVDMLNVQLSYEQLMDSDYDTNQSLQQLASYVSFQGETR
ncbi:MAG: hypothetical protein COC19_04460 [SAR86 cluster bacterium]|uniref:Uncharacterized protein n=1 Tax=SAR86 cluster bacterium TaxID=2030880 RepID=A0A2A4MQ29_9GAMM|nr:MAG: hypothetical protein COC19_04460 [SAR86 cluster bacterium]